MTGFYKAGMLKNRIGYVDVLTADYALWVYLLCGPKRVVNHGLEVNHERLGMGKEDGRGDTGKH